MVNGLTTLHAGKLLVMLDNKVVISLQAQFESSVISVQHQDDVHDFTMYSRPLWDWALDLLRDTQLAPHFVFDAQRLYKFDGSHFKRFIDEPWTADAFWDAQVCF